MTDKMAYQAAKRVAGHMGRTFMEYLPRQKRFRKGTLMIFKEKIGGRIQYELRIATPRLGMYRYPFYPRKYRAKELWELEHFMHNVNLQTAKPKMKKTKSGRTKSGVF